MPIKEERSLHLSSLFCQTRRHPSLLLWNWWSYVLSGLQNEHQFLMVVGHGGNGKGLFDFLLKAALCDYMQTPNVALITTNKQGELEAPSVVMATCMGALLVTMQEAGAGVTIDPANLKRMVADDHVMSRFLCKNPISARWLAAILMASNKVAMHERHTTNAMGRRARLLRF